MDKNEFEAMNDIVLALKDDYLRNVESLQRYISETLKKDYSIEILATVLSKLDMTEAKSIKTRLPYLTDEEFKRLDNHQKKKNKVIKICLPTF